jgi:cellulose synthase/poly-beta-1,6-N-acetylglucosamine synthase-like glycosyltransferase
MKWYIVIYYVITYAIFIYSAAQLLFYVLIAIFSVDATRRYTDKNSFTDYKLLAVSPYAPSISILAPAYNEGANIIENVRSLLSIYYNNLELILVNDGSKDNSLQQLITAYDLVKIDFFVSYQIPSKEIRAVYKSRNAIYKKLVVVDKMNGGKADALNAGINIASNDYIVCIDVDCVLEQDALLKLMKPFMETTGKRVIATGGVVRIANSCVINHGRLLKVNLPQQYLPRMQALEYIRAFLLGRMAWSRLNGLLLISGAFGAFDKEIAIKAGGYNHNTVGEDMELVVRMRRYMEELNLPYKVAFIPDPLCWTEAPANYKILGRQRNRWTRGTIETITLHKKMFFNPKFGLLGMLSYPYWFFFEMCAPGVEFLGFVAFVVMACMKLIYWQTFFAFLAFIITFGYLYSAFAIYMEVKTYNQYNKKSDIKNLLLTALTEPFVFHPFVVWSGVKGYIDKLQNKSAWGEMTRQGLNGNHQPVVVAAQAGIEKSIASVAEQSIPASCDGPHLVKGHKLKTVMP